MEIDHSWKKKELEKEQLGGKRYLHFDSKVSVQAYADRVCDPEWVLRHGFLPFLHIRIDTPRVRFSETEQKRLLQKKSRDIFFASHVDSLIYSRYAYHLQRAYEQHLADKPGIGASVLAYRSIGRNNLHFAKETFDWIQAQRHPLVALCFDIKSFFDNMCHAILLENWKAVMGADRLSEDCYRVFQANTRFAWVEEVCMHDLFPELHEKGYRQRICSPDAFREVVRGKKFVHVNKHDFGVPQGSALSAVLSNVYMLDLDAGLVDFAKEYGGLYRRYSDDILIVCEPRHETAARELLQYFVSLLKPISLNNDKTDVTYFERDSNGALCSYGEKGKPKNMQYLGVEFDGKRALIRSSSLSRYHRKRTKAVQLAIGRAIGKHSRGEGVFMRKLFQRYTHLNRANFIGYVYRASAILESKAIREQVAGNLETLVKLVKNRRGRVEEEREQQSARDRKKHRIRSKKDK